jgi:hypothetical protein
MGEACNMRRKDEKCINVLLRDPEQKRIYGRTRYIWNEKLEELLKK